MSFLRDRLAAKANLLEAALAQEQEAKATAEPRATGPGGRVQRANVGLADEVVGLREQVQALTQQTAEQSAALTGSQSEREKLGEALAEAKKALQDAEERLAKSTAVVEIDPRHVRVWALADRDIAAFEDEEFVAFREDIVRSHGNAIPALVRPVADAQGEYELIYGRRRHQAVLSALQAGADVSLRAIVRDMSDVEAYVEMARENEHRASLSPIEKARSWLRAIEEKLLTQAELATTLGLTQASVSQHLELARLEIGHPTVVAAFGDPRTIRRTWCPGLKRALAASESAVLAVAARLADEPVAGGPSPAARFAALCAAAEEAKATPAQAPKEGLRSREGVLLLERESMPDGRVAFALPRDLPEEATKAFLAALADFVANRDFAATSSAKKT